MPAVFRPATGRVRHVMFDRFFRKKEPLACPATAIIMLTVSEDPDKLLGAFRSDARAYVLKGCPFAIFRPAQLRGKIL